MTELIQAHQRITGLIIQAELNGFQHTLKVLIDELRKIDEQIAEETARMRRKVEFV